ncbi:hypothetical protein F4810DRAFT_498131 [Camillea tinctor]|nr:hypothetical protein F4810DRAFT_498131 [Camillea tinctor]
MSLPRTDLSRSRDNSGEDCARQKFIVWAAVKRNRSVRMAASDRLRCPLVRCGEQFHDHESMLRHLTKCQYLSTGEYLCFECMKVEKFNDEKCKSCLAHPTKRRRIINMAKHFFSNIGNKSRQVSSNGPSEGELAIPPPSYDSLVVDAHQLYEEQEQQRQQHQQQQEEGDDVEMHEPPQQLQIELNGTELLELDSTPLLPTAQLDSINYDSQSTSTPTSSNTITLHTQPKSMLVPPVGINVQDRSSSRHDDATSISSAETSASGCRRPSLALDTSHLDRYRSAPRNTYLSPSSSLRSTRSSQGVSPITPWSAISKSSSAWTSGTNDTAMTSPITPLGPNNYPVPLAAESRSFGEKEDNQCPSDPCGYSFGNMPELPGDNPLSMAFSHGLYDPLLFSFNPKDNYSWMSSVDTEISLGTSVNMMFTDTGSKPEDIPSEFRGSPDSRFDTRSHVVYVWDTLQEHISSSREKLVHFQGNSLVERLQTESARSIALTGLASLKKILSGNDPTDPFDYLCFIHVMYAFSLIVHEDDRITWCNIFYNQALAYRSFFDPPVYPDFYSQVVAAIWQPAPEHQSQSQPMASLGRSSSLKGKETAYRMNAGTAIGSDPLVTTAQNFLDTLETSVIKIGSQGPEEVTASELWMTHRQEKQPDSSRNNPFTITGNYIIRVLGEEFQGVRDLQSSLRVIDQRLQTGSISTVRRLELELIQAGKGTLMSPIPFDKFIPRVKELCDPFYVQQGFHSRTNYQVLGVSLIEALVQNIAPESQPLLNLELDPFEYLWPDLSVDPGNMGSGFPISVDSGSSIQQHQHQHQHQHQQHSINPLGNHSNFNPVVGPIIRDQATPTTQASDPQYSKQTIVTTPLRPEATGESLAVPVVSSPDSTQEIVAAISKSPGLVSSTTHPSISEGFGSNICGEKSKGSSLVAGTGQKVEASDCCEICGYRPKGDPQWFKGSMAKHKKLQHSTGPPTIYKCPFPGCNSQYKNRQDNLRQHQIEKNHFVGDEAERRPHKRKKISQD